MAILNPMLARVLFITLIRNPPRNIKNGHHSMRVRECYRKRHKYLTVVIDHLSGRVVWAGKERKAKTLLRFFRKLGPQRAAELEAVSMDMWE